MIPPTFFIEKPLLGQKVGLGVAIGFVIVFAAVSGYFMNKPANVDFLIATDSEMKKVNWTSRRELIGSTKIVVIFMFLIATYLFVNDLIFGELMHLIHVLKFSPFQQ
jgi:preprotein translocase SecE subunit